MKTEDKDSVNKGTGYQLWILERRCRIILPRTQFKLSDLALSYRTDIGQYLAISGSNNYRFYDYDPQLNQRVNKLLFSEGKGIAELTDFRVNLSTSFHGEKKKGVRNTLR